MDSSHFDVILCDKLITKLNIRKHFSHWPC